MIWQILEKNLTPSVKKSKEETIKNLIIFCKFVLSTFEDLASSKAYSREETIIFQILAVKYQRILCEWEKWDRLQIKALHTQMADLFTKVEEEFSMTNLYRVTLTN